MSVFLKAIASTIGPNKKEIHIGIINNVFVNPTNTE